MEPVAKKLYYKIGEVCDLCEIEPHVLRYWETEFSQLSPSKNSSGQRLYRYRDLQLVSRIKQLLYEEGYTIAGAGRKLATENFGDEEPVPHSDTTAALAASAKSEEVGPAPASVFHKAGPAPGKTAGEGNVRKLLDDACAQLRSVLKILE